MPPGLISHYRIVRRLGSGGMGEVFLAQDTKQQRLVALKVMSAELAANPTQRKRFRTEARAAFGLSHPHICTIQDIGETPDGRPFIAMEYIEGQTLSTVLQQRRLKLQEVVQLGIELAEALGAAHAHGLIHRDIKPGNLMLDRLGHVKLMDFGLAKWVGPDQLGDTMSSAAHTRTGMLIGTPQYMSPEQALGRRLDSRTDLFSLGVVLYEAALGQRPFLGKTLGETINSIINQPALPLSQPGSSFPPALDRIILRCLEKDPENRYQSAAELVADLRQFQANPSALAGATGEKPFPAQPASRESRREQTTKTYPARWLALGLTAFLALGGWLFFPTGQSDRDLAGAPTLPDRNSIAVWPFENLGVDQADEYLSDGISEDLCMALTQVKGVRVAAWRSCLALKRQNEDVREVGRRLNVRWVLSGSLTRAGDKLRVNALFSDAASGFHLWATNYDGHIADILDIRRDVALQVIAALKVQLGLEEVAKIRSKPTQNPEAYVLCLRGRQSSYQGTREGFTNAVRFYEQAIAIDPRYALAYAGIAAAYQEAAWHLPPRFAGENARRHAETALRLDGNLAQAHIVLGNVRNDYQWDMEGARREYERALELEPNLADAHRLLGWLDLQRKQYDHARKAFMHACKLDPLSPLLVSDMAVVEFEAGDYLKALELCRSNTVQFPQFTFVHVRLARVCEQLGHLDEARSAIARARDIDDAPYLMARHARLYALSGKIDEASDLFNELKRLERETYVSPAFFAWVDLAFGRHNEAISRLRQAVDNRDGFVLALASDPYYDPVRSDPRFAELVSKVGLPAD